MGGTIHKLGEHIRTPDDTKLFIRFFASDDLVHAKTFTGGAEHWRRVTRLRQNAYEKKAKEDELYAKYDQAHVPIVTKVLDDLGLCRDRSQGQLDEIFAAVKNITGRAPGAGARTITYAECGSGKTETLKVIAMTVARIDPDAKVVIMLPYPWLLQRVAE